MPPPYRLEELEKDYHAMHEMLFGNVPDFETLISQVEVLETEINSLSL